MVNLVKDSVPKNLLNQLSEDLVLPERLPGQKKGGQTLMFLEDSRGRTEKGSKVAQKARWHNSV